jgi:hypothetical protein
VLSSPPIACDRCLDHRQDAGADRLGQLGPGGRNMAKIVVNLTDVGGQKVGNFPGWPT